VRFVPDQGHRFITFPITGTSWGNRAMNGAGLALGISSQMLPGLRPAPGAMNSDLAIRVILQTCATVDDVRAFCHAHPFTLNIVCSDAAGNVLAAHHTQAGLCEIAAEPPCAMTNHVVDDQIVHWLHGHGLTELRESATTRFRRAKLLAFAAEYNGASSAEQVRRLIADRDAGAISSICPPGNVVVTYANPQAEPHAYWVAQPQVTGTQEWTRLSV
jgi:acyl-CoA:6-aminopenicillanic acid acyl transferase